MSSISLSFHEWSYPTKHKKKHLCCWGECGYFAYSSSNAVTIYTQDNNQFTPFISWAPYETKVTAMAWSDGSSVPSIVKPWLALSCSGGDVAIFDLHSQDILGKFDLKNDYALDIIWSPFIPNEFYMGTKNGSFYICKISENNFPSNVTIRTKIDFGFPIKFIVIDSSDGNTIAVSSKKGQVAIIPSLHNIEKYIHIDTYMLLEDDDEATSLGFFPSHHNFLIMASKKKSIVFGINETSVMTFFDSKGIRFIKPSYTSSSRIIIGYDDSFELWECNNGEWKKLHMLSLVFVMKSGPPTVEKIASLDDSILFTTSDRWITIIKERNNKLYITQRSRLMPSKPIDWDFKKGSISFITNHGMVLITSWTPESEIKEKGRQFNDPSTSDISYKSSYSTDDAKNIIISSPFKNGTPINENEDYSNNKKVIFENIGSVQSKLINRPSFVDTRRISITNVHNVCGNSCTLLLQFKLHNEGSLQHIKWVSRGRLIAYGTNDEKNYLYLIDIKKRTVIPLMEYQLQTISIPISDVVLSQYNKIVCVLFSGKIAVFLDTKSNPQHIGTITFSSTAYGSFSPSSNEIAFVTKDGRFYLFDVGDKQIRSRVRLIQRKQLNHKKGSPCFLSWLKRGILMGTKEGVLLKLHGDKMHTITSITGSVKSATQFTNHIYLVINENGQGFIHKEGALKEIKKTIKNYKYASDEVMLVRYKGNGGLTTQSITGSFKPFLPPCVSRSPLLREAGSFKRELITQTPGSPVEMIQVCRKFGYNFLAKVIDARLNPDRLKKRTEWLFGLVSDCEPFSERSFKLALYSQDLELAHKILMRTKVSDPSYMLNLTKAALFDIPNIMSRQRLSNNTNETMSYKNDDRSDSEIALLSDKMEDTLSSFLSNGRTEDATEMLLIIGCYNRAIKFLIGDNALKEAALIMRLQEKEKRDHTLVKTLATKLIKSESFLIGCELLSESGFKKDMENFVSEAIDADLSVIFASSK